jgi:hypothetical protein
MSISLEDFRALPGEVQQAALLSARSKAAATIFVSQPEPTRRVPRSFLDRHAQQVWCTKGNDVKAMLAARILACFAQMNQQALCMSADSTQASRAGASA